MAVALEAARLGPSWSAEQDAAGAPTMLTTDALAAVEAAMVDRHRLPAAQSVSASEDGGFHTPNASPERHIEHRASTTSSPEHYWIGDSQAMRANARADAIWTARPDASKGATPDGCQDEAVTKPVSSLALISNGVDAASAAGLLSAKGFQERLLSEKQELERQLLEEQVSEADAQAHLDGEMSELSLQLRDETSAITDVIHQIEGVGRLFKEELPDMDLHYLQVALLNEEQSKHACEVEYATEERELRRRIEAQQHSLDHMAESSYGLRGHLRRMESMQAWLRGDIEDVRRTRNAVEKVGRAELEERDAEHERALQENIAQLRRLRSEHDTWRARTESEVFRLRRESKSQASEEQQLADDISRAQRDHTEVRTKLRDHVESSSREDDELSLRIGQLEQECHQLVDVDGPLYLAEQRSLALECEGEEQACNDFFMDIKMLNGEVGKVRSHNEQLRNWEMSEASVARRTAIDRQEEALVASQLQREMQLLDQDMQQARSRGILLREELEQAQRGILGVCLRRKRKSLQRFDIEAPPAGNPPLPPPSYPPSAK